LVNLSGHNRRSSFSSANNVFKPATASCGDVADKVEIL
jgi:hypothetical protein